MHFFPLYTKKNEAQTLMPLAAITIKSFSLKMKPAFIFELKNQLILKQGLLLEY